MKLARTTVAAAALFTIALAGCSSSAIPDAEVDQGSGSNATAELTIRYGTYQPEDSIYGVAIQSMIDRIHEASNGSIAVDFFPGGTLGSEQNHVEAVREGSLEMVETGTAGISNFIPESALFELWYANDDAEALAAAFETARPQLAELYEAQGFQLLGAFYDGPRSIVSLEPIESLEDVQGARLRVPSSDLYVQMADGLGAQATVLPLGDVYTGLQNGTIDAAEGSPNVILTNGWSEVARNVTLDRHVYNPLSIVFTLETWNGLTDEQREIVQTAVDEASAEQLELLEQTNAEALEQLRADGVNIIELDDREAWAERVASASEQFAAEIGDSGQFITDALYD